MLLPTCLSCPHQHGYRFPTNASPQPMDRAARRPNLERRHGGTLPAQQLLFRRAASYVTVCIIFWHALKRCPYLQPWQLEPALPQYVLHAIWLS